MLRSTTPATRRGRMALPAPVACMLASTSATSIDDTEGGQAIKDPAVRVALQYAVDVPTICQTLLAFDCERASSMVNRAQ